MHLIISILDRICEDKRNIKDDTKLDPIQHLLKIRTWGTKWKKVIDKIDEWASWQWANAKIDKESLSMYSNKL
jgi:hypothetical protein